MKIRNFPMTLKDYENDYGLNRSTTVYRLRQIFRVI